MKQFTEVKEIGFEDSSINRPYMLNVFCALHEFYALIALEAVAKITPFKHSHKKWIEDFNNYKEYFMSNLAQILYDYTVFSVLTELRHCNNSNYENPDFDNKTRYSVLLLSKIYTAESILKTGVKMFDEDFNPWKEGYGGYPWLLIAKAGLMYKKVPDIVFIDHCVDLCHNNGSYFNKHLGILICTRDYRDSMFDSFLDKKKHSTNPFNEISKGVSYIFKNLVKRAFNLGIIQENVIMNDTLDLNWNDTKQQLFLNRNQSFRIGYPYDNVRESFGRTQWNILTYKFSGRYELQYFDEIDLNEVFEYYIPVSWGTGNLLKEKIYRTEKDYEDGHNLNRGSREEEREEREERRRNRNRDRRR